MIHIDFITDPNEVHKIILDDEIFDRVTDDNCPDKESIRALNIYKYWHCVGAYLGGEIVGLIGVHESEHGPMIHMHMLKEYREYALDFAERTLQALLPKFGEFYAEIPSLYPDVLAFSKKVRFKEINLLPEKHLKNGIKYDVHLLHFKG